MQSEGAVKDESETLGKTIESNQLIKSQKANHHHK